MPGPVSFHASYNRIFDIKTAGQQWVKLTHRSLCIDRAAPAVADAVRESGRFLAEGNRKQALRYLDRAWRLAPQHMGTLGPVYGEQLLADGDASAALAVLDAATKVDPRPDTEALAIQALQRLGRVEDAKARLASPPDFGTDGRVTYSRGVISGWVRYGREPDTALRVRIADESGRGVTVDTTPHPSGNSRHGFELRLARAKLKGTRFVVSAVLPDGAVEPLPDSPLLLTPGPAPKPRVIPRSAATRDIFAKRPRKIDIIIPVYAGHDDTQACIESVLAYPRPAGDVVVIDDASPEPKLSAWLRQLAKQKRITLLRNETNLGFSATVNRGLAVNPDRDVVVLNSDTVVHGNWLQRLRAAAYSARNIGSVTPLTNDGTIASYPRYKATEMTREAAADMDTLAARVNKGKTVELPVGVGFCMYVKRACLDAAGELDAAVFGAGYGEEVDLCMRARAKGWRHVLAADTFVLHRGGGSFGKRRDALLERSARLLSLRHPKFRALVEAYDKNDPLRAVRRSLAEAPLIESQQRRALLVTTGLPGGAERFIGDRADAMKRDGLATLILRSNLAGDAAILTGADTTDKELHYAMPAELPQLMALLRKLPIAHAEFHQFMGLPPQLIEAVRKLPAPYDIHVLDYVWLCPQITLIDKTGRYCGEPENVSVCERCIKQKRPNLPEKIGVAALRKRSAKWLAGARRVLVPANDVAQRLARYFPGLHVEVRTWQPEPRTPPRFNPPGTRVRVALLGAIGQHKGYDVLLDCARDANKRDLPLEFTVIGPTQHDAPLLETRRIFVTGAYHEKEASHLLRRENPHVILLPSVWPETWSYTLTHALETGLPVVSFDIGAIGERMHRLRRGLLLPLATPAAELNDHLLRIATSPTQ